jgi:hypothetical protein
VPHPNYQLAQGSGNLPAQPLERGMNDRNQRSQSIGKDSRKGAVASVLCVTAILYFAIQWKYASRIGPNKIFSASRMTDQADFAVMIDGLSKAVLRACNRGNLNTVLFDDSDSALPYIETKGDHLGGCMVTRETLVTPFSKSEMDSCNVVYIREYVPSYADQNPEAALRTYNTLHTSPWILMDRWVSNDERFGFALYRHPCSVEKDVKWK